MTLLHSAVAAQLHSWYHTISETAPAARSPRKPLRWVTVTRTIQQNRGYLYPAKLSGQSHAPCVPILPISVQQWHKTQLHAHGPAHGSHCATAEVGG